MTDAAREALLAALAWQIELGADETIAETPQDRFAEALLASPVTSAGNGGTATGAQGAAPRAASGSTGAEAVARRGAAAQPASPQIPPGRALAQQAQSLEALHQTIATWEGSDLRRGARNCVFADGNPKADLMIIGEAPGADEDRLGKPFVGRAGQLLDRMLAAIGLDRTAPEPERAAYITNILPWRPPGNRTPSEQEAAAFLPFVLRHIELARPKVLLTLGNTPTKALLGTTTGIRRMRGGWMTHDATGLPLLPSFHPAYLLRQPLEKRAAWQDLLSLRRKLDSLR